ncbi:vacuolar fusion protein ccz1 [Haplosporangium sp. Z 11]|nr:vacuolar fusion protein ccz1 [Haplosporangium sp. Z 11]
MYGSSTTSTSSPKPAHAASSSPSSSGPTITPATLGYFCIYNPDFGPTDETQHEQLLYYVARKTVSIDAKMRNIGLAQGLVNFARIFSPTAPCENVHSQKNRLVFYEAEPGYWLHLCIELGTKKRYVKGTDGQRVLTEYLEHEIHDTIVSELLKQAYAMYRVAHGTMDSLVNAHDGNTRPLQRRLEEFFESWVLGWDFEKAMTLERALDGINYLPLSKNGYGTVDRLVKTVREKYEGLITNTMVTFEDQLVSSDIRDGDLRAVWKQVVQLTGYEGASANNLAWGRKEEDEARKRKTSTFKFGKSWTNTSIFGFYKSSSRANTPPSTPPLRPTSRVNSSASSIRSVDGAMASNNSNNAMGTGSSPRPSGESGVIVNNGGKAQVNPLWFSSTATNEDVDEHFGIIFKHKSGLNLTFFAPVDREESQQLLEDQEKFSRELEEFLAELIYEPSLLDSSDNATRSLLEDVSRQVVKDAVTARGLGGILPNDKEIRFLYFNKISLAIKVQLGSTTGKGGLTMGSDIALSLLDIKQDFDRIPDATEITTRSPTNHWIVGKRFEDREVYMIVSRKDSTLVEVEEEVRKLTSLYFNGNSLSSASPAIGPSSGTPVVPSASSLAG